jgi:hypothetical protein
MTTGERAPTQTKMLVELPHVGNEPVSASPEASARTLKSSHPAFAEYTEFTSEAPTPQSFRRRQTRYVDQAHVDPERERGGRYVDNDDLEPHRQQARSPLLQRQQHAYHKPRSRSAIGAFLSDAHEQFAPFAGLIVTAALVAAAGLLFHMMSGGKSSAEYDEFALPGFQVEALEGTLPTEQPAPLADVSPTPEGTEADDLEREPSDVAPTEEASKTAPAIDVRAASAAPPVTESVLNTSLPLGQLSFPQTTTPQALDYTKAADPDLQQLPAVAERSEVKSEAINR